jgi:hypothetical protein
MKPCVQEPLLRWRNDISLWETSDDVCTVWQGLYISVPAGFLTDLATIPWPLIGIPGASRYGRHNRACILHDWAYMMRGDMGHGIVLSRYEADRMFFDVMTEDGVGWQRYPMYWAVRISPTNWRKFV